MKKIIPFLACFTICIAAFAQPNEKTLSKIPVNTPILVSFNFSHFLEKVSTDQIKSYDMVQFAYDKMKKSAGKDSSILKKLYSKPKAYGLNLLPSAVLFVNYDTTLSSRKMMRSPLVGISIPLSSSKKFEKFLVQSMKEKYLDFVEKGDGYKFYINKKFGFAWDKKSLIFIGGDKKIQSHITEIMTMPESGSVLSKASLKKAISHDGDICMGLDLTALISVFKKYTEDEMKFSEQQSFNLLKLYKYGEGESFGTLDFVNGGLEIKTESKIIEGQNSLSQKLSKETVNSQFSSYLPNGKVYGGISVASNISLIKEYFQGEGKGMFDSVMVYLKKDGVTNLIQKDSSILVLKEHYWADTTTIEQRSKIDEKVKVKSDKLYDEQLAKFDSEVDSTLAEYGLDMNNAFGVFKGDFLLAMTGVKEIIDTFKTYDYIENEEGEYEYLEVEKTKLQKIPAFRSFATINDIPIFQTVLDSLVAKEMLVKGENSIYSLSFPQLNLSLALHGNILCFSNDVDFISNTFVKGDKVDDALTGEAKDLLFNFNSSMFIDVESIVDLLDKDVKKGSGAMFVELARNNFSKIIMTSKVKDGYSQGLFKLGMKPDKNSFLKLMDTSNELFLKFSGNKF